MTKNRVYEGPLLTAQQCKNNIANIKTLEEDLERVTQSYRFRIGDIAVETLQNPTLILKQLKRLYSLYHEYTYSAASAKLRGACEIGQPTDPLRNLVPSPDIPIKRLLKLSKLVYNKNRWSTINERKGQSDYEQALQKRLRELTELARNGIQEQGQRENSFGDSEGSRDGIAMILHNALPLSINGYAVRSQHLIDGMMEHQLDVSAFLRTSRDDIPQPYYPIGTVIPDNDTLESYINTYSKLIEIALREKPPKIVHAASNYITGLAAGLAARRLGIPFIYEVRGLWEVTRASVHTDFDNSLGYAVQQKLETQCAIMADRVIAISTPLADMLVARGVARKKIRVIPNGAKVIKKFSAKSREQTRERFGVTNDDIVVGFIGSITPYEGLGTLLEAISKARSKGAPLKLVIIGNGSTRRILESKITQLGLQEHCQFLGQVTPSEAELLHSGLDIASYVRDSTPVAKIVPPLKPLQAMSSKVATIISDLPAMVELVGGTNTRAARICPPNNSNALAHILHELAENNQKREVLASEGYSWVAKNRNWSKLVQNLKKIYDEVESNV